MVAEREVVPVDDRAGTQSARPRRQGRLARPAAVLSAAVLSAALLWLGTGLEPLPWLTWLAPLPLLAVAKGASGRAAAAAGFAACAIGSLNMWSYYVGTLEVPVAVVAAFLAMQALTFAGVITLYRALMRHDKPVPAVLAASALWTAVEYLVSLFSPGGTFAAIGYTQSDVLPVIQIVSVTGLWGVSFLLIAAPAIVAALAVKPSAWRSLLLTAAILVTGTLGYGLFRSQQPPPSPAASVTTVALVDVRQSQDSLPLATPEAGQILQAYLDQVPVAASAGATVMVLPEKVFKVDAAELDELGRRMSSAAAENQITIAIGLTLKDTAGVHNIAMAYTGQSAVRYDKQHLVTGWEDHITAGDRFVTLPGTSIGLGICKDLDHPQFGRAYGRLGTTMLLAPSLDFDRDGWLHSRIAVVRGVENGMAAIRPAGHGRLVAADPHGRLLIDTVTDTGGDTGITIRTAQVRTDSRTTALYTLLGDWFAWLCVAIATAGVAWLVLRRRHLGG